MKMMRCYRERVLAFWKWFEANEAKLADYADNVKNYDPDDVVEFFSQGLSIAIEGCTFNVGGKREVTITPEGSPIMVFLTTYLVNSMPNSLKDRWSFFPWKSPAPSVSIGMHNAQITADDIFLAVEEEDGRFGVAFYNATLAELEENQAYQICYIMLDLALGENISMGFIAWVDKAEAKQEGMIKMSELREYMGKHSEDGIDDNYNPIERYFTYKGTPSQAGGFRHDVIIGHSCLLPILQDYYNDEDHAYKRFQENGVKAAFLAIDRPNSDDDRALIDTFVAEMEEDLLGLAGSGSEIGIVTGQATGEQYTYVDLLIYDEDVFKNSLAAFLKNYKLQVQYCDFVPKQIVM